MIAAGFWLFCLAYAAFIALVLSFFVVGARNDTPQHIADDLSGKLSNVRRSSEIIPFHGRSNAR